MLEVARAVGYAGALISYGLGELYALLLVRRHSRQHDMQAAYPWMIVAVIGAYCMIGIGFFLSRSWALSLQILYLVFLFVSGILAVGIIWVINRRYHDLGPRSS